MSTEIQKTNRDLFIAKKFIQQILDGFTMPEFGHGFGIVVRSIDLIPLVFKGFRQGNMNQSPFPSDKCSVGNVRDDVVLASNLQEAINDLENKTQETVLDLLAENVFDIRIRGHYMEPVQSVKRRFIIAPDGETLEALVKLEDLLLDLVKESRVHPTTQPGLLLKECKCDWD
jgi:hypothetical protein